MRILTELPGPKRLPLLGNLLQLDLKQLHRVLERWGDEFGTLYKFQLGQRPVVVITDPELNQTILRNRPKLYRRLSTIETAFEEMGVTGVFSAEGEDWKRQRRLAAHALDAQHLPHAHQSHRASQESLEYCGGQTIGGGHSAGSDALHRGCHHEPRVWLRHEHARKRGRRDSGAENLSDAQSPDQRAVSLLALFQVACRSRAGQIPRCDPRVGFVMRGRERLAQNPELAAHPTNLLEAMLATLLGSDPAFTDEEI